MGKVTESAKLITALLPGGDCRGFGGCGFSSCSDCAQAIAAGAPVDSCPACRQAEVDAIAEALNVETVAVEEKVAFIKCAGDAAGKKRFSALDSCSAAVEAGFLEDECHWGCLGIGSCADRCEFEAMTVEEGKVNIDKEKCNGCMACITACPQKLISVIPRDASNFIPCSSKDNEKDTLSKCGFGCIGCADCALACPENAIELLRGNRIDGRFAAIDYSKCVGCVACTVSCRKKIIVDELHDLAKVKQEVAFVRCSGGYTGNKKLTEIGIDDCRTADDMDLDALGICSYGCTGFGNCTKVCRYDAIKVEFGTAVVDEEKCVGCGDCIRECPRGMITMVPYAGVKQMACSSKAPAERRFEVCYAGCIACGDCAENCPAGAITMNDGNPVVDSEKCENCGVCTYVCSRRPIKERKVPEYTYLQSEAMKIDKADGREW
ncbi:MAG: 4Fe-4S binding protein [Bacillota bacterium]|nr:4Fe-4S binding protein [Bacillota bacterium]